MQRPYVGFDWFRAMKDNGFYTLRNFYSYIVNSFQIQATVSYYLNKIKEYKQGQHHDGNN